MTVCVSDGDVHVAVTVIEIVPLGVVISVGTANVAVPEAVNEFEVTVHVTPAGQPEVTDKLTVVPLVKLLP